MTTSTPTEPPRPAEDAPAAAETAARIDELMAQPVKGRPQITVVGDDAVSGINPFPQPSKPEA
ncbi:MAG TPA: hypothetical protein VGC92_07690 [Phenylobacterium sp.]|jgi:hypothetical protein